jgi:predicted metal-dependent hydrolase
VAESSVDADHFAEGIKLFNSAEFFEAHEVLEDVWRGSPTADKKFLQGLIQAAVAFHHHSTGNIVGARSLLARARRNLSGYPDEFRGVHLAALLESLARWESALEDGQPVPSLPRI